MEESNSNRNVNHNGHGHVPVKGNGNGDLHPASREYVHFRGPHVRRHTDSVEHRESASLQGAIAGTGEAAREWERLRHQNADLRKSLTGALEESAMSKKSLRQAQTFERIGRVSSGVAHDINNFIAGILGVVGDVYEEIGPQSPHRPALELALSAARKAAILSKRLLSLGRRQTIDMHSLDLNQLIREMTALLSRMIGTGIELEVLLDPALGTLKADASQMEQVLLNLVLNARDAMPTGGKLTLQTSTMTAEDADSGFGHLPRIKLEVSDTGVGMDPLTLQRAFDPFFTTKAATQGTGLGLATLKGIIEEHGGTVSVVSELHHGTRFTIVLPCAIS
jgi:two-component system cell cycle sensor histidine kinase/response regulator CckA